MACDQRLALIGQGVEGKQMQGAVRAQYEAGLVLDAVADSLGQQPGSQLSN